MTNFSFVCFLLKELETSHFFHNTKKGLSLAALLRSVLLTEEEDQEKRRKRGDAFEQRREEGRVLVILL